MPREAMPTLKELLPQNAKTSKRQSDEASEREDTATVKRADTTAVKREDGTTRKRQSAEASKPEQAAASTTTDGADAKVRRTLYLPGELDYRISLAHVKARRSHPGLSWSDWMMWVCEKGLEALETE